MFPQLLLHSNKKHLLDLVQPHLRQCHQASEATRDDDRIVSTEHTWSAHGRALASASACADMLALAPGHDLWNSDGLLHDLDADAVAAELLPPLEAHHDDRAGRGRGRNRGLGRAADDVDFLADAGF